MSTTTSRASRLAAGVLAGSLTLLPLTACSFSSDNFSCSGSECSVTLSGDGAEVEILGTTLGFGGVQDGRASLEVGNRSEEHTSELQSRQYLVCRLLLEKKNNSH